MGLSTRTNDEWLQDLRAAGEPHDAALADLRESLRQSALFCLRRHAHEVRDFSADDIAAMAEDAAQEAIVALLERLDAFRGEARFLTWASKFGIGYATILLRKRQWRDVSLDRLPDGWDAPAEVAIAQDGWAHPELAAQRQEIWQIMQAAVREDLTEKQRLVFNYILIHGVSTEVVAPQLGITPGALYKLTHDARRKFRKALERRGLSMDEVLTAFANPG